MPHDKARRLPSSDGRRPRKRSSDEHDAKGHYCNRCHRGCRGHRVCCTFVSRLAGCLRTWATPGFARACARSMKGRRYMAKHAKRESDLSEEKLDDSTTDADGGAVSEGQDLDFGENDACEEIPAHHVKSRRMRTALIVVSVALVALMAALGYFAWMLVGEARDVAYQSTVQSNQNSKDSASTLDAGSAAADRKETPELVGLIGKTEDEAVALIGRGATETSSSDITEETGEGDEKTTEVVGRNVTLALTDETSDSKGNTPSVYLTLDKDGVITEAGYSASVGSSRVRRSELRRCGPGRTSGRKPGDYGRCAN